MDPHSNGSEFKILPPRRLVSNAVSEANVPVKETQELANQLAKVLLHVFSAKTSAALPKDSDRLQHDKNPAKPSESKKKFNPSLSDSSFKPARVESPAAESHAAAKPLERVSSSRRSKSKRFSFLKRPTPLGMLCLAAALSFAISGIFFYSLGNRIGRSAGAGQMVKLKTELTPETQQSFDKILLDIQEGRGKEALEGIKLLQVSDPDVPSLSLTAANASLLANELEGAQAYIEESIKARELVSDALTLQALMEALVLRQKDYKKMGDPKVRLESLLRQAIAADPTNPRPFLEMATMYRLLNRSDEALALLKSAKLRLSVTTDTLVADVALALLQLQMLSDENLPELSNETTLDVQSLFSDAYTAMRLGKTEIANARLSQAREILPANLFSRLVKDPSFFAYSKDDAYAEFLKPNGNNP
jgi:tetratricopeptide (TPR) repeat protein